jgi:hypothetical protein
MLTVSDPVRLAEPDASAGPSGDAPALKKRKTQMMSPDEEMAADGIRPAPDAETPAAAKPAPQEASPSAPDVAGPAPGAPAEAADETPSTPALPHGPSLPVLADAPSLAGDSPPPPENPDAPGPEAPPEHAGHKANPPTAALIALPDVPLQPASTMPVATPADDPALLPLEQRVRRLEDALAQLQNLRRQATARPDPIRPAGPPGTVPPAAPAGAPTAAPAAAPTSVTRPPGVTGAPAPARPWRRWLLFDIVAEARVIARMFVDPRYSLSWSGRLVPLLLIAAFVTSSLWMPGANLPGGVGYAINKTVDLLIGFVLFKVLSHEARRYRETAPDLPPMLRL